MTRRMKVRDGIVGLLLLVTLVLAKEVSHHWLYATAALALLMVVNSFIDVCPVCFILRKTMPDEPAAAAKLS
jgi:hypothetical protein